jgi:DNA-binding MarR family transcriptional regulator
VREELDADEVAAALQVSISVFVRRVRQSPLEEDLTVPEMAALSRLDRGGPATSSELARAEQITPQGMGATLGSLVRRGLVERRADTVDGRRIFMVMTEAGRQTVRSKRSARTRQLGRALTEKFTPEELGILTAAAPLIGRLGESI